MKYTLPNLMSYGRLLATPFIVWMIAEGTLVWAFYVFVAAGISDALDGYLARRLNLDSDFGRIIDPVADKILLAGTYLALCLTGYLPIWIGILIFGRDLLIVVAWMASGQKGDFIRPDPLRISKFNTALQIALAAYTILSVGYGFTLLLFADITLARALLYLVAVTTLLSGASYFVRWVTTKGTMEKPGEKPGQKSAQKTGENTGRGAGEESSH